MHKDIYTMADDRVLEEWQERERRVCVPCKACGTPIPLGQMCFHECVMSMDAVKAIAVICGVVIAATLILWLGVVLIR